MARTYEKYACEYQNVIEHPPVDPNRMYSQACSSDGVTIESWRKIWIDNYKANHDRFGSFADKSIAKLYGRNRYQPAILAGSGPSLKYNAHELKKRGGIPLVSCLHNFHYLEDQGVGADYYVTLDSGPVVIEEVYEGGSKSPDEYWEMTKDKTLLAYVGTDPRLFDKWKGEVLFFNCPIPDAAITKAQDEIEPFRVYVSNGGNVLGACMYIAKGFLGCNPLAFIGADFSFSNEKKFHPWDSKYDAKLGYVIKATDVFGNKAITWQSYANFKAWFDYIAIRVPGLFINCTEGGIFGAYPEGNIAAVQQMELKKFISMYHLHDELKEQCEKPSSADRKILF